MDQSSSAQTYDMDGYSYNCSDDAMAMMPISRRL